MNSLNSAFLRVGDTFTQCFSRPGRYVYDFALPGLRRAAEGEGTFTVNVKEGDVRRDGVQHNVLVKYEGGRLKAVPPQTNVLAGDVVTWYTLDPSAPGFSVLGRSEADSFSSAAMTHESLYTHAFGSEGRVEWESPNSRKLKGTVVVTKARTQDARGLDSYRERLEEGTLVVISGDRVEPSSVEIVEGQTVCFAVEKAEGEGVAIVDRRLKGETPTDGAATRGAA